MKNNREIQEIADAFSICHDGTIVGIKNEPPNLILRISCLYLAEMIDPSFVFLYYKLINYSIFELIDYDNHKHIDFMEIQKKESDIYEAEILENGIIAINVHFNRQNGGVINIKADRIEIYNQNMGRMEFNELNLICREYWGRKDG